jgi:hypothetical protein
MVIAAKTDERGGALLLRIQNPFIYKDVNCEYFVATPRHKDSSVDGLAMGRSVQCALIRIPPDRLKAEDPFDTGWWRGGVAAIGEVTTKGE